MTSSRPHRAFTLVELLVVVSIIAILATIAAPNFLAAQTRSKVARTMRDIRVLAEALEAYRVDNLVYPHAAIGDVQLFKPLVALSTPIAYVGSIPEDPFGLASFDFAPAIQLSGYQYKDRRTTSVGMPGETYGIVWETTPGVDYMLHTCGPNAVWDVTPYVEYDPTNGSASAGDITRFGPM
jgi:type II secretion system protein G